MDERDVTYFVEIRYQDIRREVERDKLSRIARNTAHKKRPQRRKPRLLILLIPGIKWMVHH